MHHYLLGTRSSNASADVWFPRYRFRMHAECKVWIVLPNSTKRIFFSLIVIHQEVLSAPTYCYTLYKQTILLDVLLGSKCWSFLKNFKMLLVASGHALKTEEQRIVYWAYLTERPLVRNTAGHWWWCGSWERLSVHTRTHSCDLSTRYEKLVLFCSSFGTERSRGAEWIAPNTHCQWNTELHGVYCYIFAPW